MMPWKLMAFIAGITAALFFVGFNLENRCDISLAFITLRGVPVIVTILSAYLLGLLSALVVELGRRQAARGSRAPSPRAPSPRAPRRYATLGAAEDSASPGDDEPLPPDVLPEGGGPRGATKPRKRSSRSAT